MRPGTWAGGRGTVLGIADLHVHSAWSDGMATVPQLLRHAERHTALDVVAVADHDQVGGALEAVEWCAGRPGGRLQAVVATEISAAWGRHVLALFFDEPFPTVPFPRFRSLLRTIGAVHDAGGVVVLPHPFCALVPSVGQRSLARLLAGRARHPELRALQAMEVCSGVVGGKRLETRLRREGATHGLALLGSSDAHHLAQIGAAVTRFPGCTPADLRRAIHERTTCAAWGPAGRVTLEEHARQGWLSLVVKPARELRTALSPAPPPRPQGQL